MSGRGRITQVRYVVAGEESADDGIYMVVEESRDQTNPKQVVCGGESHSQEAVDDEQLENSLSPSELAEPSPPSGSNVTIVQIGNHNTTNMNPCQGSPDSGIGSPPVLADTHRLGIPCSIPFNKCRFFSGRNGDMAYTYRRSIAYRTERNDHQGQVFVLHGVGGVGKSTLAAEFGYEHMDKYYSNGVFWVDASNSDALPVHFANIGFLLNLNGMSRGNVEDNIDVVKKWMINNDDWLCIFDNADDACVIAALTEENGYIIPQHSLHGDVIVTSRSANLQRLSGAHIREVTELSPVARREFLLRRTRALDIIQDDIAMRALEDLVKTTSGILLKLEQIGAYMVERNYSFSEYNDVVFATKKWRYGEVCTGDRTKNIANTYEPNFIAVETANPNAMDVLLYAALCNTSEIPFDFFHFMRGDMDRSEDVRYVKIKDLLFTARNFSLFRFSPSGKGFVVHQVVQEQLMERTPIRKRKIIAKRMLDILFSIYQTRQSDGKLRREMLTHAEEFLQKTWINQSEDPLLPTTPENLLKIATVRLKSAQTYATLGSFDIAEKIIRQVAVEVLSKVDKDSLERLHLDAEVACQRGLISLWKGFPDRNRARDQLMMARDFSMRAEELMTCGAYFISRSDMINVKIKRAEMSKWLVCAVVERWDTHNVQDYIEEAKGILEGISREDCNSDQLHQIKRHQAHLECQTGKFYKLKALEALCRHESSSPCVIDYLKKAQMHYERAVSHCPANDNRLPVYKGQLIETRLRLDTARNNLDDERIETALDSLKTCLRGQTATTTNRYAAFLHRKLAYVLHLKGDYRRALNNIDKCILIMELAHRCQDGLRHCKFANTFHLKGTILRALGRYEEACSYLQQAVHIYEAAGNETRNPKYRICEQDLAFCREQVETLEFDCNDTPIYY